MNPAAFKATYAEWRVIKTRATVQLVFEIPIEQADQAYQALGGMPIAAREVWCGIARLAPDSVQRLPLQAVADRPRPVSAPTLASPVGAAKERRRFGILSPTQQAGMLCNERAFRLFLAEKFDMPLPDPDEAASVIRHHCKVQSRKELTIDNAGWSDIVLAYRLWQREPEVVG